MSAAREGARASSLGGALRALPFALYGARAVAVGVAASASTAAVGLYFLWLSRSGACGRCGLDWNALSVVLTCGVVMAAFPRRIAVRLMVITSMTLWSGMAIDLHVATAGTVRRNEARLPECPGGERSFYIVPPAGPGKPPVVMPDCIVPLPTLAGLNGSEWSVVTMRFAFAAGLSLLVLEALAGGLVLSSLVKLRRRRRHAAVDD